MQPHANWIDREHEDNWDRGGRLLDCERRVSICDNDINVGRTNPDAITFVACFCPAFRFGAPCLDRIVTRAVCGKGRRTAATVSPWRSPTPASV